MRFVTVPCCLDHLLSGILSGSVCLYLLLVLMILLINPILLVCWLSGLLSWALFIGLLVVWILGLLVSLMLNCLFFMSLGLVRGCLWRRLILAIFGRGVQFQCRLFHLVQALIIWRSCRFIGALMRSLCLLLGGLGRFVPCSVGANHCRLCHIGWEECGQWTYFKATRECLGAFLEWTF